ncbi:cupin domain-containing protein [Pantoea osteomyelitidis]|uniref:Cupin domain-containing protein n=2 Tax=Pantoea osteomyelitidis TaxID=3230026 RepID=A0ABW7Q167_9GAMM
MLCQCVSSVRIRRCCVLIPLSRVSNIEMSPGNILYIPPPYDGFTYEDTLNYSVGFRGPNGRDLMSIFADYALENALGGAHYSDLDLRVREHPDA